jgi:excisionase family DNA binding protein
MIEGGRSVPRITLTRAEAATALGISEDHFDRHVRDSVPAIRSGRKVLFPVAELERWAIDEAEDLGQGTTR